MTAPVVAADMDGTLTTAETWRGVLEWVRLHHPSPAARRFVVVRIPSVMLVRLGLRDREPFRDRWIVDQARLLRGLPEAELALMGEWVVERHLWPARRTAAVEAFRAAVGAARADDPSAMAVIASASYAPVVEAFGRRMGADAVVATPFEVRDGIATGGLAEAVRSGARKADAVRSLAAGGEVVVAFGDSVADIAMLELARRPVAVAPDAGLRRVATDRGWEILAETA